MCVYLSISVCLVVCMCLSVSVYISVSFVGMCECICAYSYVSPDVNVFELVYLCRFFVSVGVFMCLFCVRVKVLCTFVGVGVNMCLSVIVCVSV